MTSKEKADEAVDVRYGLSLDSGRSRKLSEKGIQYSMEQLEKKYKSLCRSQRYLSEIASENDEPLETVRKKYFVWMEDYEKYLELCDILLPQISSEEHDEFVRRFDENYISANQFKSFMESYISKRSIQTLTENTISIAQELRDAHENIGETNIQKIKLETDDNESLVSSASSYASVKRKKKQTKKQRRVELETRKSGLAKRREIELAKVSLKLKEEEFELDTDIAVSQARSEVLDKFNSNENLDISINKNLENEQPSRPRFTIPRPRPLPVRFDDETVCVSPPPIPSDRTRPFTTYPSVTTFRNISLDDNINLSNSNTVIQSVVQHLRKPVAEVKKFSGNPLEYRRFLRQFNAAHRVVYGFGHLRGERTYKAAMCGLEERYGDEEVIATAFIGKALNLPQIRAGDAKALDEFALLLVECQNAVESINVLEYSENIKRLMLKLPFHLHDCWRSQVFKLKESKKSVRFKDFTLFVKAEAKKMNDPAFGSLAVRTQAKGQYKQSSEKNKSSQIANATSTTEVSTTKSESESQNKCSYCNMKSHSLDKCRKIIAKDMKERYDHIKENGLCFGCLRKGHKSKMLLRHAFLDTGSSASFCAEKVMRQLGASGKRTQLTLSTMGKPFQMKTYAINGMQVSDMNMDNIIDLPKVFTKESMPVNNSHIPTKEEISKWEHLAQISFDRPHVEIGLMLGSNVPDAYTPTQVIAGPSGSPHATKTKLGWVIWNVIRNNDSVEVNRLHIENETTESLEDIAKKSINMDFPERLIDDKREPSREDKDFMRQAEQSIHLDNGHYCVSLPFRDKNIVLPDNTLMARKRLHGIRNKFMKDPKFKEDYTNFMKVILEKGYAEPAPHDGEKAYALHRTVEDSKDTVNQDVQDTVKRSMHVDDCLTSACIEKKAVSLVEDITKICKAGGFRITKWLSNNSDVIDSIPEEERTTVTKLWSLDSEPPIERALGVYWFVEKDSLGFQIHLRNVPANRRGMLSITSSVYDPHGIASPFVLKAKSILQRLCKNGVGWDEEISEEDLKDWNDWLNQLPHFERVSIDRCYKTGSLGKVTSCQLHGFADASNVGFGMVFYLRFIDSDGQIYYSFVFGKARVAPLETITIPRMELTAAASLVKLCKLLQDQFSYSIDKVLYWTDSTSVLRYINNRNLRFHTFVANRVAVIHEATEEDQWHYVNTKQNPADCASRGMSVQKLSQNDTWFKGPEFLWKPESEWPVIDMTADTEVDDPEVKKTTCVVASVHREVNNGMDKLLNHYSGWSKLKRAVGWILLAMDNLRTSAEKTKEIKDNAELSEKDPTRRDTQLLERAETALISYEQRKFFTEEFEVLQTSHDDSQSPKLKGSSVLRKLDPFTEDGLLRIGGRLQRAYLPYDTKHPLILPKDSVVSGLLIRDAHKACGHLGKNTVLAFMRQQYWTIGVRTRSESILSKCVICRKYRAPHCQQKMDNLPEERLASDEPPFSRVGMDFFGPFELKRGRSIVKRYGVIFTCLVIRAVHLEVAASLDTDSCINAIRRLIARRGKPTFIRSDNGTNLVDAERELEEEIHKWNHGKIQRDVLQHGIHWEFNPPSGSHFGGIWERLIRLTRQVLYGLMKEQNIKLDDEGLATLFCEVEAILNGRPLTTSSDSVNDPNVLTPNHLLLLRPGEWFPPGVFEKTDNYCRRRWRQVQYLAYVFWRRWTGEYLLMLQKRQKWLKRECNIRIGDLVLIADNLPRHAWNLGRIQEVVKDKNNFVCIVKVKTATNVLTRPVAKLVLIL
ncbi:uncharacterized protein [Argopecten irradians]|uniref:uncharacterized protein n=1 Tax=Argopecten irradians TaxID=31199 RepID=UPI0037226656